MFALVIVVLMGSFVLEMWLSILNYRNRLQPIPENVADVFEASRYQKWLSYTMDITKFAWVVKSLHTSLWLGLFVFGFFPWLQGLVSQWTPNLYWQSLFFLFFIFIISFLLDIPMNYHRQFSIEAKYGFNKTTNKTFIGDTIKSFLLSVILGGALLYLFQILNTKLGVWFYVTAWSAIIFIQFIVNFLYTKVFIKIFNKLSPLEEGELKEKILAFAKQTGYEVGAISVMDASRRSTKLNAFFSGFGRFKQVVLYDTLVKELSSDEVVAVLAHEIGHSKHKDIQKNFLLSALVSLIYIGVIGSLVSSLAFAQAFGFATANFAFGIILFLVFLQPLDTLLGIPMSALSRRAELRADAFVAQHGYQEAMISALKVLARTNLSNLTPHPLVVKLTYSHPPMSERIQAITKVPHLK